MSQSVISRIIPGSDISDSIYDSIICDLSKLLINKYTFANLNDILAHELLKVIPFKLSVQLNIRLKDNSYCNVFWIFVAE